MASTTQTPPRTRPPPIAPDPASRRGLAARVSLGRVFAPVPSEFLLIASTALLLTGFGLVMVLSATSATATAAGEPPYEAVIKQAVFAVIGIPLMFVASRLPIRFWKTRGMAGTHRRGAVPAARVRPRPRCGGEREPQLDHDRGLPVPAGRIPQARPRAVDGLRAVPQADAAGPVAPRLHPGRAGRRAGDRDRPGRSRPRHGHDPGADPARRAVLLRA